MKSEYLIDCCKDDIIDKIKYIIITRINTIFNLKLKINNIKPTIKPRANKPVIPCLMEKAYGATYHKYGLYGASTYNCLIKNLYNEG